MPTESTFLLAGLLFLAAALGYFFAVFGDDEADDTPSPSSRLNADYIKGLNFLLNEQPDQALEVFMRMVEVDDETLETHFALGSLFRRRGEVDRAIRVHQNIIARPNLSDMHREHALASLAEDYLSAGLFDRAETLFQELRASPEFQLRALQRLVRIYEVTHDWEPAIDVYRELEKISPEPESVSRVSHYYCELAEQAIADGSPDRARGILKKAGSDRHGTVRARLTLADLAQQTNHHAEAIRIYREVMQDEARLTGEIVPRLAASCRALDDQPALSDYLRDLLERRPEASKAIALATIYHDQIVNGVALDCLRDYILQDPILSQLVATELLQSPDTEQIHPALARIRGGLGRLFPAGSRYRCGACGYLSSQLLWQCPSCRSWETVTSAAQPSLPA